MGNVPELRFPEFSDTWREVKLAKIATFSKGKGISKKDIDDNGAVECIRYGELYTEYGEVITKISSRTSLDVSDLVLSKANDIIIPASGETQIDIATASCVMKDNIALSGDINIIRTDKNGVFLAYYLNGAKKIDIAKLAQGISVVHLYATQLKTLTLKLPSFPEQQKIADFLTAIDENITILTDKIIQLKTYKKGIMQKLLSGELRFPGFTDEWREVRLGEIVSSTPRPIPKPKQGYWRLGLRSHAKGTFHTYVDDPNTNSMETLFVVRKDDLIVNITFAWEQAIAVASSNDDGKLVSHRFPTYVFKDGFYPLYFKYNLTLPRFKYELANISPGGAGRNRVLNKKDFLKLRLTVPDYKEQQKIADFLTAIDDKLTIEYEKLDQLKSYKQGLLQKMFV